VIHVISGYSCIACFNTNAQIPRESSFLCLDIGDLWYGITHWLLPIIVSQVSLIQHVVPLAIKEVMEHGRQIVILRKIGQNILDNSICCISLLLDEKCVSACSDMDFVYRKSTKNRLQYHLEIRGLSRSI
jgi:hypothetical protein